MNELEGDIWGLYVYQKSLPIFQPHTLFHTFRTFQLRAILCFIMERVQTDRIQHYVSNILLPVMILSVVPNLPGMWRGMFWMLGSDPVGLPRPAAELGGMNLAGEPPGVDGGIPGTPPRFKLLKEPSSCQRDPQHNQSDKLGCSFAASKSKLLYHHIIYHIETLLIQRQRAIWSESTKDLNNKPVNNGSLGRGCGQLQYRFSISGL